MRHIPLLFLSAVSAAIAAPWSPFAISKQTPASHLCSILNRSSSELGDSAATFGTIEYTRSLVKRADLVVLATAIQAASGSRAHGPPAAGWLGFDEGIQFAVLEVLRKPSAVEIGSTIYLVGRFTARDRFRTEAVPYTMVGFRGGDCVDGLYRRGGTFLLLLQVVGNGWYTPYWEVMSPTNIQVRSPKDPWVEWVRGQL